MKRGPGEWLREHLLDRAMTVGLFSMAALGWLCGAGTAWWVTLAGRSTGLWTIIPEWSVGLTVTMIGPLVFGGYAAYKAWDGWRWKDMRKGSRAEVTIGQAIEYALTRESCAVAHHVEDIAKVGDIDHLVATPRGLWVVETKTGRVPPSQFPETLRRIATNVDAVRAWAPETPVTGCLAFAHKQDRRPKPSYREGSMKIRCFEDPNALMRALRDEARTHNGPSELARRVWKLGRIGSPNE